MRPSCPFQFSPLLHAGRTIESTRAHAPLFDSQVCQRANYRAAVVTALPRLSCLDDTPITDADSAAAAAALMREARARAMRWHFFGSCTCVSFDAWSTRGFDTG